MSIEQSVGVILCGGKISGSKITLLRQPSQQLVNVDEIIVRVGVGALYKVDDDNGDISGSKVKYNVFITDDNGAVI